LLQQRPLIDGTRRRIRGAIRAELLGECWKDYSYSEQRHGDDDKADARKKTHDDHPPHIPDVGFVNATTANDQTSMSSR
jgi:hypothetical protein